MDGFIYIFAVIGIAVTAVTAAVGVALTVTMARLTYTRLMSVVPALFGPVGVVGEPPQDPKLSRLDRNAPTVDSGRRPRLA